MKRFSSHGIKEKGSLKYEWMKKPMWAMLLTIAGFFFALYVGTTPAVILWGDDSSLATVQQLAAGIGVSTTALGVVYFLRNRGHQSWSGVRLHLRWTAILEIITGIILALFIVLASNIVSVTLGVAEWQDWNNIQAEIYFNSLIISFLGILLVQAFPEELLFRGHLIDTLSSKVSSRMVLLLSSAAFGSFHIFSQSPAEGLGEQLMYVVFATSYGFALAACRIARGSIWLPVGLHTGHNLLWQLFVTIDDGPYSIHLMVVIACMVLVGFLLLKTRHSG